MDNAMNKQDTVRLLQRIISGEEVEPPVEMEQPMLISTDEYVIPIFPKNMNTLLTAVPKCR